MPDIPQRRVRYRGLTARDIALIGIFAALLAVLSMPFAIPVGPVPITLQTLGVMLAPSLLGAKRGTLAVLTFLALTLAGLPLLPGGRGGVAPFLGPTGGYLLGWVVGALVIGLLVQLMLPRYRFWAGVGANIAGGIGVVYLVGVPWSAVALGDEMLAALLGVGVFLPGDLAKAVAAAAVAAAVHRAYPVPPAGRPVAVGAEDDAG
ncbi:biotin transporter BioY [Streptomonospora nanhaiensis]|uniref:Biotin transporter n=1 Tax=Streptomonospora nanhaiensis TaxID=1323731 RepID=A0A853BKU8_9ACTN|nr:biotin transporter BioY [Streptomonospora nanhaiensis]MBV2363272.1 biotin transporter BioY [Streptomonospora nanhaiensis]MBX9389898.1 biotin transporter BioY [Streptomonospora nanhaiensis]NYI95630.1 biotin transport system substrate-specific component [Streptomonospora nanhaiensis]